LTDSTVLRNIGVPIAHIQIATKAIHKGLGKLILNEKKIKADLEQNWAVVAEAIQTVLRRAHYPMPYEALKELTQSVANEGLHAPKVRPSPASALSSINGLGAEIQAAAIR
jgi:adenylosuccinate lyase